MPALFALKILLEIVVQSVIEELCIMAVAIVLLLGLLNILLVGRQAHIHHR